MNKTQLYLRGDALVEPLVDGWYAWAYLIPPATAARNIAERHLRIMQSYISAPLSHVSAVKNPKLQGGPFVDLGRNRVEEVRGLLDRTLCERRHLLGLSQAISELDALLREKGKGQSLEGLYDEVPAPLKGYVELVYDLNNQPSFRLLEKLLYRSQYYDRSLQSFHISTISGDDRPFVLSTPRLPDKGHIDWQVPFESPDVDRFFELRTRPAGFATIKELLGVPSQAEDSLFRLFSEEPPPAYGDYRGQGARWRYFGHACILLETRGHSILLDPVLSYTYETNISRYTYDDLPQKIDFALITHNHQDHILFETLLRLRTRIGTIVVPRNTPGALQDPSLKLILENCGFRNIVEVTDLDELIFDGVTITAIPFVGEHADLNIASKSAYLVSIDGHTLMFAADSCNISPQMYEHVHDVDW